MAERKNQKNKRYGKSNRLPVLPIALKLRAKMLKTGRYMSSGFSLNKHYKPHIHATYGDFEASVGIDGELLSSSLPVKQLKFLNAWLVLHEDEKKIKADGWFFVKQVGSHWHYKHSEKPGKVTIPFHGSKDLRLDTVASILQQAGLE